MICLTVFFIGVFNRGNQQEKVGGIIFYNRPNIQFSLNWQKK
jgi:hypothetical protein